jgi:hypothetical protein
LACDKYTYSFGEAKAFNVSLKASISAIPESKDVYSYLAQKDNFTYFGCLTNNYNPMTIYDDSINPRASATVHNWEPFKIFFPILAPDNTHLLKP